MYGPPLHNLATAQFVVLWRKFLINGGVPGEVPSI
jgi:hypothetical protein